MLLSYDDELSMLFGSPLDACGPFQSDRSRNGARQERIAE
jgi:hypothetical protein